MHVVVALITAVNYWLSVLLKKCSDSSQIPPPVEPGVSLLVMEQGYVEPWRLAGGVYPLNRQQLYLQPTTEFTHCHLNLPEPPLIHG